MWLPWESARLRAWAEELEEAGDVLGDRIQRSLAAPAGSSSGSRARLSLEANRASERGVGSGARRLLKELRGFDARWQHGVLVSLRPRLYGGSRASEEGTVERLRRLLREPVARFLQELEVPGEWELGAWSSSLLPALVEGEINLRVLRIGEANGVCAHHAQHRLAGGRGRQALEELLGERGGAPAVALSPRLLDLLRPSRGLQTLFWGHLAMPLWSVGPADNPSRRAQLDAWLGKAEPTATTLALVGRGLWDRSSAVRRRAIEGLGELGLAAAALVPELLRLRRRPTGWARALYDVIDRLTEETAFVEAFAARLQPDVEDHLRWLRWTRSVGAKAAIPVLVQALAIAPVPAGFGTLPPKWQRDAWQETLAHLRKL